MLHIFSPKEHSSVVKMFKSLTFYKIPTVNQITFMKTLPKLLRFMAPTTLDIALSIMTIWSTWEDFLQEEMTRHSKWTIPILMWTSIQISKSKMGLLPYSGHNQAVQVPHLTPVPSAEHQLYWLLQQDSSNQLILVTLELNLHLH